MEFASYLKTCRETWNMTQDELVSELYNHDTELFQSLDASGLSKWERGVTHPTYRRIASILRYFQRRGGRPLPCVEPAGSPETWERELCREGMRRILGRVPKHLIVDLSMDRLAAEHFSILPLRHFERMEELLEVHQNLYENLVPPYSRLRIEQLREWALHPSSLFYVTLYKRTALGLFFAVRLRPDPFDRLMAFEITKQELTTADFATEEEEGRILVLSLFSLDARVATLLLTRFYAHLITHQETTTEIGVATALPELEPVIEKIDLRVFGSKKAEGRTHLAYRNTLFNLLAGEGALHLLFPKKECPEEPIPPARRSDDPGEKYVSDTPGAR
jgi:transcriptional regulator with XRE-family HTH domain